MIQYVMLQTHFKIIHHIEILYWNDGLCNMYTMYTLLRLLDRIISFLFFPSALYWPLVSSHACWIVNGKWCISFLFVLHGFYSMHVLINIKFNQRCYDFLLMFGFYFEHWAYFFVDLFCFLSFNFLFFINLWCFAFWFKRCG